MIFNYVIKINEVETIIDNWKYNNEKLERKRTYDQVKRKRKTSWQKKRNWLVHNSEIDRMTCSVCIQYASSDIDKKAIKSVSGRLFFIKAWTLRNRFVILLNTFLFNDCTIFAAAEFTVKFSRSGQKKKKILNKLAEKLQLVSSQQ
jgi:hypothetical protein